MDVREGRNANLAERVILHLCEYSVAQLRNRLCQDAGDNLRGDQAEDRGGDRHGGVMRQPVYQPAVQVRDNAIRQLGEDEADQREDNAPFEVRPAFGPEIGQKRPQWA